MAAYHAVLTLSGAAQTLSSALPSGVPTRAHFLALQAGSANAALIHVGTTVGSTVTSSNYGFRIEIPVATIPAAPSIIEHSGGATIELSQISVIGANNEKLHIFLNG